MARNIDTKKALEAESARLYKQIAVVNSKIEKLGLKNELPKLKKQYEGKYFRYDNGTGRDCRWWLYSFCKQVINVNDCIIDSFETINSTYKPDNSFIINHSSNLFILQEEISEEEYFKQLKKFGTEFTKLFNNSNKLKK